MLRRPMTAARSPRHAATPFEERYRRLHDLCVRLAEDILKDREAAEDVYQAIMMRVLRREGRPEARVRTDRYILRSVANLARNWLRNDLSRGRLLARWSDSSPPFFPLALEEELQGRAARSLVQQLVSQWPEFRRRVWSLCAEEGWSSAGAARMLGCRAKAVEKQRARIREDLERLATRLNAEGGE